MLIVRIGDGAVDVHPDLVSNVHQHPFEGRQQLLCRNEVLVVFVESDRFDVGSKCGVLVQRALCVSRQTDTVFGKRCKCTELFVRAFAMLV